MNENKREQVSKHHRGGQLKNAADDNGSELYHPKNQETVGNRQEPSCIARALHVGIWAKVYASNLVSTLNDVKSKVLCKWAIAHLVCMSYHVGAKEQHSS